MLSWIRWQHYPEALAADLKHPVRHAFIATIPVSIILLATCGVSLLGTGQVLTLKYLLRKGFDMEIESSTVENRGSVNWRKEK